MNDTLKALRQQMEAKHAEAQAILSGDNLNQEAVTKATELTHEITALKGQFDAIKGASDSLGSVGDFLNSPMPAGFQHPNGATFLGFVPEKQGDVVLAQGGEMLDASQKAGMDPKLLKAWNRPEYKSTFWRYLHSLGNEGSLGTDFKFLQEGSDVGGGYTVPEDFYAKIVMKEPTPTRLYSRVTKAKCSRDRLTLPKVNYTTDNLYTSGIRVTWTGENPTSATQHAVTDPTFGQVVIPIYTAMMSLPITRDLLEDSAFDIESWAADRFRETIELLKDNMILNGTGTGQPTGILQNPGGANQPAVVNSGNASALTADGIISLGETLPEQYEDNACYVFNKVNAGKAIRLLKDGQGRYLFARTGDNGPGSLVAGRPTECNGYPFMYSGFMPNVAANAYPVLFGDLSGYYMIERVGFTVEVLREILAQTNQVLLLGRIRLGGMVAEEWKLNVQQVHV